MYKTHWTPKYRYQLIEYIKDNSKIQVKDLRKMPKKQLYGIYFGLVKRFDNAV